nr:retrotransposon protein, putative, unclassified [Tanacetum cinerariifolium]
MRIRSPDRLLGFPSGFPLGMVPPKNLDERNSLFPYDSVLTSKIASEVYVSQPDGFVDPDNPNHVYNLKKALLSSFLLSQDNFKGSVDRTLSICRNGNDLLLKYGFESCDPVDTPMVEKSKLDEDKEGKVVDPSHYRGMIGTLLYLIASRPGLQFVICMCARYQAWPTKKHFMR